MIRSIRFTDNCQKFKNGINYTNNFDIIEAVATCLGGFCEQFENGTGRRLDLNENEVELSVSTHANINNKNFYFTRCYTNSRFDTTTLDQKQDIVKYAKKIQKELNSKESEEIILPLITYYNNSLDFVSKPLDIENTDVLTNRTCGYTSCLIVKDHFNVAQQYFSLGSFICWQKQMANVNDSFSNNYIKAYNYLKDSIKYFNCNNIRYDINLQKILVNSNNVEKDLETIESDKKIYIAIMLDLLMRALILNPNTKDPFGVEGLICISYDFLKNDLNHLINNISKIFYNTQIIIYED